VRPRVCRVPFRQRPAAGRLRGEPTRRWSRGAKPAQEASACGREHDRAFRGAARRLVSAQPRAHRVGPRPRRASEDGQRSDRDLGRPADAYLTERTVTNTLQRASETGTECTPRSRWQRRAAIAPIRTYQLFRANQPSPCRFVPSCSEYAVESLERHGLLKGGWLAVRRLSRCRPLGGTGFDPVPD
jgi:uncharacterized protein